MHLECYILAISTLKFIILLLTIAITALVTVISPLLVNEGGIVTACVRYDSPPSTQVEIILQTRSGGTGAAQGMKQIG